MSDTPDAGPELDALIAEHVFGWTRMSTYEPYPGVTQRHGFPPGDQQPFGAVPPTFSTDIAFAWLVVRRMDARCCDFTLEKAGGEWYADFRVGAGQGYTAPLAICRAALEASGRALPGGGEPAP